jgi:predicted phage terminase large subunit-like protein
MTLSAWEAAARLFEPQAGPRWATPGQLAVHLDPRTRQTPALDLIDAAIVETAATPDGRLIISMPPQEGKSQRTSRRTPLWKLQQDPETRIAICSYEMGVARRWGRAIRDDITTHGPKLGLAVRDDLSAQHEWQLHGHDGGVYSVGIGGALTGRPVDLLIIDDPIKDREQADSPTYRDRVWDWWLEVGSTRLAPGAPVIVILTRWHEDDLAGRLLGAEDGHLWRVVNIPAQADHRPEQGEADPLGRAPGEFMLSARGRTVAQWEAIKVRSGGRTWTALYQGRPAPAEGGTFKRDWWREYTSPRWIERPDGTCWVPNADEVVCSWDMAFKDLTSSDYVVGQVWARYGLQVYLLDQIHERLSFVETCKAVRQVAAKWPQATRKFVEDKANGTAVINQLARTVPGLIPVEPDGSKEARAAAVSPFVEAGSVFLPAPELAPWIAGYIDEHAAFPAGTHDDQVDGTSQALNRLLLNPILNGDHIIGAEDLDAELADYEISPW